MIAWCLEHRNIVAVLSIFIFIGGLFIYSGMERQENPDVVAPGATVQVIYPGATSEEVEKFVIKPLETKISEISDIKLMTTYSLDNVGVIVIRLKDISDAKITETWNLLKDKVDQTELPEQAHEPEIDTDLVETYGMLFTVSSNRLSYKELKEIADEMKDNIEKRPGIAEVIIDGYEEDEIHIDLDILKMKHFDLSIDQIMTVLAARNVNIPGGALEFHGTKIPVSTTGEYKTIEDIANTVVGMSSEGNVIYVKDIANIYSTEAKREIFVNSNAEKALLLSIKYSEGQNVVKTGNEIAAYIKDYQNTLPEDIVLRIITDQASYVNDAIKTFESNLISAIVLVVVVVLISMGLRSAVVVSSAIPITVMATFLFMRMSGIILHQVSISSLIVCLGLLVANAIVANDSMYLYLSRKPKNKKDAIVQSIKEINIPILTSTLTTIASFLPLLMMQGIAGKFVKTLPIMVTVALLSSYFLSLTAVPAVGYTLLKVEEEKEKKRKTGLLKNFFIKTYEKILNAVLKVPKTTIVTAVAVLLLSGLLIPTLGLQLFPFVDRDQYVIDITLMEGTTADKTKAVVEQVEGILLEDSSVDSFLSKVGDGIPKFYTSFFPNQLGANKAQLIVNGEADEIPNIQKKLESTIVGARIEAKQLENAVPVGLPVQVRVSGEDINVLRSISEDIKEILYTIDEGQHVQDDFGLETLKMIVDVNQDKASMVGLTNYDISKTVRMVVDGLEITKLKPDDIDEDIPVMLRIPTEDKDTASILENVYITSRITGKNIPITQVAQIRNEFVIGRILRRDRERTITTGLYPKPGYSAAEVLDIVEEKMEGFELPPDYRLEFGGENEDRTEAFESLIGPFFLAGALIYLILMFQFNDLIKPLIIMGTIPLSFIGVIWGLKITGYPIGFMALMGAVSLMGIVVNNGIVLLDYISILAREGHTVLEAIKEASVTRLRPIMIGMVTTVIGLVPMGLAGGTLWAPLAYSIIFGLLVSSILTMLVIPASFMAIYGKKDKKEGQRDKKTVEKVPTS